MTKRVTLVKDVILEELEMFDPNSIRIRSMVGCSMRPVGPDEYIPTKIQETIVPIHKFNNSRWSGPIYIAVTPEVQKYLKMPLDVLDDDLRRARNELELHRQATNIYRNRVNNAKLWQRIKHLFGGKYD